jgi:hypothetical protein
VPVDYLQIIKDGKVEHEVRLDKFAKLGGKLPSVAFDDSGWFAVRAVTANARNYQFALSGPYYVERRGQPRVRRASVEFFLTWIGEAEERIRARTDVDAAMRAKLLAEQAGARVFFEGLLKQATAE